MLQNKDIVCISSIDWDFIWQGHQEIMSVLARNGNRVLFVENTGVRMPTIRDFPRLWTRFLNWKKGFKGIRKENENLYIYSPLILPFPYSKIAIKINRSIMLSVIKRWMNVMEFHNPIVWSFLPTRLVMDMLDELEPSVFIYYCIDDFVSSSKGAERIKKIEEKAIKLADLVFVTSHKLYTRCVSLNKETHLFPFGINIENYNRTRESSIDVPVEMREIKKPVIGYVGGVHKWIDMDLLKNIASRRRDISIVVIGPKQTDLSGIENLDNVFILGKKKGSELPNYVKFFDAGIIPYKKTAYTENVYPTKINEYLAMGKPVISTRIPEVVEFDRENGGGFIYFIDNENDIDRIIANATSAEDGTRWRAERIRVANSNSWAAKIESMCGLIEEKSEELQLRINRDWLDRFKRFYKATHKKAIKLIGVIAVFYLVVFYTPFVWFLASPLKIENSPATSDTLVVFGGGVGEGGRPGSSTTERAWYSVELYKKGYADSIIYSSGYTFKYNDAEVMKLFAASMGVPNERILLEQNAGSTYENVKYTLNILKQKKWHKIILITSPYNTRRAELVFRKLGRDDIKVLYCPVRDTQFYYRYGILRFDQLNAILHEYLGILYYLYKGYI